MADPADLSVMDRCVACGARLGQDAEWCGQCYAPVPGRGRSVAEAPETDADLSPALKGYRSLGPGARLALSLGLAVMGFASALVLRPWGIAGVILPFALSATALAMLVDVWRSNLAARTRSGPGSPGS